MGRLSLELAALKLVGGLSPAALVGDQTSRPTVNKRDLAELVEQLDRLDPGSVDRVRAHAGRKPLRRPTTR